MEKGIVYVLTITLGLLITFFGLGPVLFADGSMSERIFTIFVVLLLYVGLGISFTAWRKRRG